MLGATVTAGQRGRRNQAIDTAEGPKECTQ